MPRFLLLAGHRPTERVRAVRRATGWSAGFGPSCSHYLANVEAKSIRACRRRLLAALRLHRRQLAVSDDACAAFAAAERRLRDLPAGQPWAGTVCVDQFDLTFWVLAAAAARRRGAVLKH
jgi:hypothetical protein